MRPPRGAIFDMDGTLLDSMPIYDTAIADTIRSLGYSPRDDLYEAVRPLSGDEVLEYLQNTYGLTETLDEVETALDRELYAFYENIAPPKPGVLRVLEGFAARNIPMCVATATSRVHVEAALKRTGLLRFFSRIFTCPEESTGKREPTIFLRAAAFLGTTPEDTFVFEDALHAIASAKRAGFVVIAVHDKAEEVNRPAIERVADAYYENLETFSLSAP